MTPIPPTTKRPRGRPRRHGTTVVNVRIPTVVYDAYCIRAHRAGADVPVRAVIQRTLTISASSADLDAKQIRALAIRLLQSADDLERIRESQRPAEGGR